MSLREMLFQVVNPPCGSHEGTGFPVDPLPLAGVTCRRRRGVALPPVAANVPPLHGHSTLWTVRWL